MHPGVDWGIPWGTELVWIGNKEGNVVDVNSTIYNYMRDKDVIVIESEGFHFIYGHTSGTTVQIGETVAPGQVIGYSGGTEEDGGEHLHFEVRPAPNDGVISRCYINPLTFYKGDVQTELLNYFTGTDYESGEDALSLGYYR